MSIEHEQSASIGAISAALAKAQGEVEGALKENVNPHLKSKYADLASNWRACRVALSKNGIAVVQRCSPSSIGIRISTQLSHGSGEWLRDGLELPIGKADAQGYGSVITYGRRYGLCAMVGIAPEDDDGEVAVGRGPPHRAPAAGPAEARMTRAEEVKARVRARVQAPTGPSPWERLLASAKQYSVSLDDLKAIAKSETGKGRPSELTEADAVQVLAALDRRASKMAEAS